MYITYFYPCSILYVYCWWFRNPANQLRLVAYPSIYRVWYISGGDRWISPIFCCFTIWLFQHPGAGEWALILWRDVSSAKKKRKTNRNATTEKTTIAVFVTLRFSLTNCCFLDLPNFLSWYHTNSQKMGWEFSMTRPTCQVTALCHPTRGRIPQIWVFFCFFCGDTLP